MVTTLVHEAIVDSILIPLSDQSPEVAWQLTLMNAQALSLNILLATVLLWIFPLGLSGGSDRLLPYAIAAILISVHLLTMGFVAEMITKFCGKEEDVYSIAERVGDDTPRLASTSARAAAPRRARRTGSPSSVTSASSSSRSERTCTAAPSPRSAPE